jgi:hypothetical protein
LHALVACWFAALFIAGCQLVVGDFKVQSSGASASDSECSGGSGYRCNGEYLLTCGGEGTGWVLKQTCASADLCDSKDKQCRICSPGSQRCDGASRQECNSDGSAWTEVEKCASSDICNATYCGNCTSGEYSCRGEMSSVGSQLWKCDKGVWAIKLDECASEGLCMASLDAARASSTWNMQCTPSACMPGAYSCDGVTLRHCRQDQTGWDVVDTCGSPELCASAVANATTNAGVIDMCPVGCGTAGTLRCDGMTLSKCRDDLTGFDPVMTCPDNTECNPQLGVCADLCTPGQYQCNDKTLRLCDSTRHWQDQQVCASAPLCQATNDPAPAGQCLPPGCPAVGAYQCDGVTLSKCRDDLMGWEMVDTCGSAALCSADDRRCNTPACDTDELRCFGSELRQCNADRTDWTVLQTCTTGQFCSNDPANSGCLMECPDPTTRCNGSELQRCTPNGWVHQATCATNDLCGCTLNATCELGLGSDGCGVVVCGGTLPTYQCEGSELEKCSDGRNGWVGQTDCGQAALCYSGSAPSYQDGYCAICPTAGELRCVNGAPNATLTKCSPDRTMWSTVQTCGSNGCIDSGTQDYCAACSAGQVLCSGTTLQKCSSDQRNFVNTTCQSSALCDATHGQCDVCTPPNSNTCSGMTLQHCSSDGQSIQTQTCPNYCDATGGQCDSCVAGTSRCSNNLLYKCASDGQSEAKTTCVTAALCDAPQNKCDTPACNPGDHRCLSTQPQVCNSNQTGWDNTGNACATAALCNGTTGTCATPACAVGETRCNGAQPQVCNSDRTGFVNSGSACATAALCGATTGTCSAPACAVGDTRCNGAQPQVCNSDRTGFTNMGTVCASSALCKAATGTCGTPACNPNQTKCNLAQPQICKGDLTGYQDLPITCVTPGLCNPANGTCNNPVCATGDTQCSGAQPQICNSDRTGFQNNGAACASTALCVSGACMTPACTAGQTRCSGAQPQVCNANLTGFTNMGTACASAALCMAATGTCGTAACNPGDTRCNGKQPQICNSDQTAWMDMGMPCVTSALCLAATGTCMAPSCSPTDRRCNDVQPQVCNANQNGWDNSGMPCATAALCVNGMCNAPVCAVTDMQCAGAQPQVCKADRSGWQNSGTACASAALCTNGTCTAPTCAPTDHHCMGNVLQGCNADRTGWQDIMPPCGSAALCDAMAGQCDMPACAATDWRCDDVALEQCNASLTGWDTKATCTSKALCDAAHHECDDCVAPAYQCTMNVLYQCDTTGHFAMLMDCGMTNTCNPNTGMCDVPTPPPPPAGP